MNRITINKIILMRKPEYNEQWHRPYVTAIDGHVEEELGMVLNDYGNGGKLPENSLTNVANRIITPSSAVGTVAAIDNGWQTPRMMFMMEVEVAYDIGASHVYILQGFTSHYDIISPISNAIDPNAVFTVNSSTVVTMTNLNTPAGNRTIGTVTNSDQVMISHENNFNQMYTPTLSENNKCLIRPEDVVKNSSVMMMSMEDGYNPNGLLDTRAQLDHTPKCSRRGNNRPSSYVGTLLKGYNDSIKMSDFGEEHTDVYNMVSGSVSEEKLHTNVVLKAINNANTLNAVSPVFTYQDLINLDPAVDSKTHYLEDKRLVSTGMDSSNWNGSDNVTIAATMLLHIGNALMVNNSLYSINYSAQTIMTPHGVEVVINVTDAQHLGNAVSIDTLCENFKTSLRVEVIDVITVGGALPINLFVRTSIFGDTIIDISIDNSPMETFIAPSFADNIFSPMITNNHTEMNSTAYDLDSLFNNSVASTFGVDENSNVLPIDGNVSAWGNSTPVGDSGIGNFEVVHDI